jgi:hypothetical protein
MKYNNGGVMACQRRNVASYVKARRLKMKMAWHLAKALKAKSS